MVVIFRSRAQTGNRLTKWLGHADPECLVTLGADYPAVSDEAGRARLESEFSCVLDDLCVGTSWKRTMPGRLRRSETVLCRLLGATRSHGPLQILDVGASDGVTTLDLLRALARMGIANARICMSDLTLALHRYRAGAVVEYRSSRGEPVLMRIGRLGLRLPRSPRRFDLPSTLLARLYLKFGMLRRRLRPCGELPLVNPATRSQSGLETVQLDILSRNHGFAARFDAIRASNVLNAENFAPAQILHALEHLRFYLREGGYLLVSRSTIGPDGEVERGTLWQKRGGGLALVEDFAGGSEIGDLVAKVGVQEHTQPAPALGAETH